MRCAIGIVMIVLMGVNYSVADSCCRGGLSREFRL